MPSDMNAESGRLVYLMGASGVGKDTLLDAVRTRHPDLLVAHRYITRDSGKSENCVSLSPEEFAARRRLGLFCLDWQAHGLMYGLGIEVTAWLERDFTVVVNGSRRALDQARERFGARLLPVLVTADTEVLRQRLCQRGREPAAEIEARLARHRRLERALGDITRIDNSRELHHALSAMQSLLAAEPVS